MISLFLMLMQRKLEVTRHIHAMILHLKRLILLLFQVVDDAEIVLKEYSEEVKKQHAFKFMYSPYNLYQAVSEHKLGNTCICKCKRWHYESKVLVHVALNMCPMMKITI